MVIPVWRSGRGLSRRLPRPPSCPPTHRSLHCTPTPSAKRDKKQPLPAEREPPIHYYRQVLRLAYRLAKRWEDPYIFWTYKHQAMRHLGLRFQNKTQKVAPWIEPKTSRQVKQAQGAHGRIKRSLNALRAADAGQKEGVSKIFLHAYGLQGVVKHMGISQLRVSHMLSATERATGAQSFPAFPPSPLLLALLQSPKLFEGAIVPHDQTWRTLVAVYSGKPRREIADKSLRARTRTIRQIETKLSRIMAPVTLDIVRDVERRMHAATERWLQVQRQAGEAGHGGGGGVAGGDRNSSPTAPGTVITRRSPLHPSQPDFDRGRRRLYGFLLSQLIGLATVDQIKAAWKRVSGVTKQVVPDTLPPLPPSRHWLDKPHLSFSIESLWCSKLRLTSQSTQPLYTDINEVLASNGKCLLFEAEDKAQGSGPRREAAPEFLWIYKSPNSVYPLSDVPNKHSNVMTQSAQYLTPEEKEMAWDDDEEAETDKDRRTGKKKKQKK